MTTNLSGRSVFLIGSAIAFAALGWLALTAGKDGSEHGKEYFATKAAGDPPSLLVAEAPSAEPAVSVVPAAPEAARTDEGPHAPKQILCELRAGDGSTGLPVSGGYIAEQGSKCTVLSAGVLETTVAITSGPLAGKTVKAPTEWVRCE